MLFPFSLELFPFPFPLLSQNYSYSYENSIGIQWNPMGMGIPIPMHISTRDRAGPLTRINSKRSNIQSTKNRYCERTNPLTKLL